MSGEGAAAPSGARGGASHDGGGRCRGRRGNSGSRRSQRLFWDSQRLFWEESRGQRRQQVAAEAREGRAASRRGVMQKEGGWTLQIEALPTTEDEHGGLCPKEGLG